MVFGWRVMEDTTIRPTPANRRFVSVLPLQYYCTTQGRAEPRSSPPQGARVPGLPGLFKQREADLLRENHLARDLKFLHLLV